MQLLRGLAAGRRAICRDLPHFRAQLRLLGACTSLSPSFPFHPPFWGPSFARAARDLGGSDFSPADSRTVQVQKVLPKEVKALKCGLCIFILDDRFRLGEEDPTLASAFRLPIPEEP